MARSLANVKRLPARKHLSKEQLMQTLRLLPVDGGLVSELQSSRLKIDQSPRIRNTYFIKEESRKSHGTILMGAALDSAIRHIGVWERANETLVPFALTKTDLYTFDGTTWTAINPATLSGTAERWAVTSFDDVLYFVSRNNALRQYTGSGNHAAVAGGFKAKYMEVVDSHIVLAYTENGGNAEPYTLRWSISGAPTFSGVGSGVNDLLERDDRISNIVKAGAFRAFVYKERSIVDMRSTGDADTPFEFSETIGGLGLLLPWSIVPHSSGHYFVSSDEHIVFFDGGSLPQNIDAEIRTEFFSVLDQTRLDMTVATFWPETNEYVIFIPTAGSTACDTFYAYDITKKRWRCGDSGETYAVGLVQVSFSIRWNEDTTTWQDEPNRWNATLGTDRKSLAVGVETNKKVYTLDERTYSYDGTAVSYSQETPDLVGKEDGEKITLMGVRIGYTVDGTATLVVDISTDGGQTFSNSQNVSIGSGLTRDDNTFADADAIVTAEKIRVRVRNSTSTETVKIRSITCYISLSGSIE